MGVVSTSEFQRLLKELDGDDLVSLVADLWAARGHETRIEGRVVVATDRHTGEQQRIAVAIEQLERLQTAEASVDSIVIPHGQSREDTAASKQDPTVIGPELLRELVLYAVDDETTEQLLQTYLDWSPDSDTAQAPGSRFVLPNPRDISLLDSVGFHLNWTSASLSSGVLTLVLLALLATGLVVAGWIGVAGLGSQGPTVTPAPEPPSSPGASSEPVMDPSSVGDKGLPLGLDKDGISDVTYLGAAHADAIEGQTYRVEITRQVSCVPESSGNRCLERGRRTISVENTMRYRTSSDGNLSVTEGGFGSMSVGVYADGKTVYRRVGTGNQTTYVTGPSMRADRFSNLIEHYLVTYLTTTQSDFSKSDINGSTLYVVTATGQPERLDERVSNYTATAVVRQDGLIRSLVVSYTRHREDSKQQVQLRVRYTRLGEVEIRPPSWYTDARNATVDAEA